MKVLKNHKVLVIAPLNDAYFDDLNRDIGQLTDALIAFDHKVLS